MPDDGRPDDRPADPDATATISGAGTAATRVDRPRGSATDPDPGPLDDSELQPGQVLGRFVVIQHVGHGAMGVVVEAYDKKLDRRIALKLMRRARRSDDDAINRFLREAQALARVSHPNVVAVYDVGTVGETSFIAMELVKGRTLEQWLAQRERGVAEILGVLRAAGAGLAAAHAAGIVHRDVKPSNVVIGDDGRVRVIDFGVARAVVASSEGSTEASGEGPGPVRLDTPLTQVGTVVGTPAYMAPEQLAGGPVDARSDQFGFAVTAYQALHGERPFGGKTREERIAAIGRGPAAPAGGRALPRHVERALARALAPAPADRYPSIDALLVDLARDPAARWRRIALGGGALLAAGAALAVALASPDRAAPCATAARALDETWNPEARAALARALAPPGRAGADETVRHATAAFDAYATRWRTMRIAACEATHVEHTQSSALLDQRMACLDRRLAAMRELLALYRGTPAPELIDQAVAAAVKLPAIEPCADVEALAARAPLPADPALRARIAAGHDALARAEALELAGRFDEALAAVAPVLAEARELGHAPLVAEALDDTASAHDALGNDAEAVAHWYQALEAAARAGDAPHEARIWASLIWAIGYRQQRQDAAPILEHAARAALARAGDPDLPRAEVLTSLGVMHLYAGAVDRAREELREALAIRERALGPDHITVAHALDALGVAAEMADDLDEAVAHAERALAIRERLFGAGHPEIAYALLNLAAGHVSRGDAARATPYAQRAVALREATLGPAHRDTGWARYNLASVDAEAGRHAEALAGLEQVRAIVGDDVAAGTIGGGMFQHRLGQVHLGRGDHAAAAAAFRQSLADFEQGGGADHPGIAAALLGLGRAQLAAGDDAAAVATLDRAAAHADKVAASPRSRAELRYHLARALTRRDPARARAEATAARALIATVPADPAQTKLAADIAALLP